MLQLGDDGKPVDVRRLRSLINEEKRAHRSQEVQDMINAPRPQGSEEASTPELPAVDLPLPAFAGHIKESPGGHGSHPAD